MKIAVATIDGISLSQYFGQSKGFVIFEVESMTVQNRELRTNDQTLHERGLCNKDEHTPSGAHSHAHILELLSDCSIVLCGGMGGHAAQELTINGILPVILPGACSAEDAVASYIGGSAVVAESGFCNCHHERRTI